MGHDIFDLIIVATLVLFTLRGAANGFIGEVAGIFSLLGGFWAAQAWQASLAPMLTFIADPAMRSVCACVILFIAAMLVIGVAARLLKKLAAFSFVAWLDRLAGAILGLIKGVLIWALVIIVAQKLWQNAEFMRDSRCVPYFDAIIDYLKQWLPPSLAGQI